MTKDQFVKKIAEDVGLTQKKAKIALESIIEAITEALVKQEKVTFTGFGTFCVIQKAARKGKNPRTKEVINIPAKKSPVFRAGKSLKEQIK
ncbi:MAG: HU family DNA-binding protein [Candidatus Cloacimonetes bacterium]|nr:HU family DNA-binding protein [Candidatus Cloacimonadota bacterium]